MKVIIELDQERMGNKKFLKAIETFNLYINDLIEQQKEQHIREVKDEKL